MYIQSTDSETVDKDWLAEALRYAHDHAHTRVQGYLESIADDMVFEMESASLRA